MGAHGEVRLGWFPAKRIRRIVSLLNAGEVPKTKEVCRASTVLLASSRSGVLTRGKLGTKHIRASVVTRAEMDAPQRQAISKLVNL